MTQYPESVYYEKEFYDEAAVHDELRTRGLELEASLRSVQILSKITEQYFEALKRIKDDDLTRLECSEIADEVLNRPIVR